jgi:hypothetical protein
MDEDLRDELEPEPCESSERPGEEEDEALDRRELLSLLKKWSKVVVAGIVVGMNLAGPQEAEASVGWVNRRGGGSGGWVNGGGGGIGWANRSGGGGWVNRRGGGGGGTGWVNRSGGSWVNRRGGGGWANRR